MNPAKTSLYRPTPALTALLAVLFSVGTSADAAIIDGVPVSKRAFREVFALSFPVDEKSSATLLCTATLIHPKILLTSAHCVPENKNLPLTLTNATDARRPTSLVRVLRSHRHKSFDSLSDEMRKTGYDFGLIILTEPFYGAVPAKLASLDEEYVQSSALRGLTVVGYGGEKNMQTDSSTGVKRMAETQAVEISRKTLSSDGPHSALSTGDSGSPAYFEDEDRSFRLIGVGSGVPNTPKSLRTGMPDVSLYAGMRREITCWIEKTSGIPLSNLPPALKCFRASFPPLSVP